MAREPVSQETVYRIASTLEQEAIPHAFMGGIAINTWGIPRTTFDLDLAVSVPEEAWSRLFRSLDDRGFVIDEHFLRGFRDRLAGMEKVHIRIPVAAALVTVDLFLTTTPFLKSVLDRRVTVDPGGGPLWVITAADLILFKVLAGRPKDLLDVENVIAVQGLPERSHLEKWSRELGIEERLRPFLQKGR
jgi:hypothetical protein